MVRRKIHKTEQAPIAVDGVVDCLLCGFKTKNPLGVHKKRPRDFALIDRECKNNTDERKTTTAVWNKCCGSFKGYEIILIEDIYGKPYTGAEQEKN